MTCDALCQEYLLFRGYTSTVAAMGLERAEDGVHPSTSQISPSSNSHHQAEPCTRARNNALLGPSPNPLPPSPLPSALSPTGAFFKSILFSPEKITTSLYGSLTHPTRKSYSSFVTLWSLLSARFFSNVVATGFDGSTVQAMEDDLRKLYVRAERARRRARENHLRRARSASATEVLDCSGSGLLSERAKGEQRKAASCAAETGSLSERKERRLLLRRKEARPASAKKLGSFCGGNRLAQRVRRRCSSAAEAGCFD
jgi:hypothetical protein